MKATKHLDMPSLDAHQGATLLCLTLLAAFAFTGSAHARVRSTTMSGPQGQSATRMVNRSQGDVGSSATGPSGGSSNTTVTGPQGESATVSRTVQP